MCLAQAIDAALTEEPELSLIPAADELPAEQQSGWFALAACAALGYWGFHRWDSRARRRAALLGDPSEDPEHSIG